MILPFFKKETVAFLKKNLCHYIENFAGDNSWVQLVCEDERVYCDSKIEYEKFDLDMSKENPFDTEYENVKQCYLHLKHLTDVQASDERIWSALCFGPYYDYTKYRWGINELSPVDKIKQHFFFAYGARRSLTRNAMSRLWWIGRLTFDEVEKFKYTKMVCESADAIMHILERNTSNNPDIVKPFLRGIMRAREDGVSVDTNKIGDLAQYLNVLGGTYILDCLNGSVIEAKIYDRAVRT